MGESKGYLRCKVTNFLLSVCKKQLSKFKTFDVSQEHIDELLGEYVNNSKVFSCFFLSQKYIV